MRGSAAAIVFPPALGDGVGPAPGANEAGLATWRREARVRCWRQLGGSHCFAAGSCRVHRLRRVCPGSYDSALVRSLQTLNPFGCAFEKAAGLNQDRRYLGGCAQRLEQHQADADHLRVHRHPPWCAL